MTIKARVWNGNRPEYTSMEIVGITPPDCHSQFDGVFVQLIGTTLRDDKWQRAGMELNLSQNDALDLALALFIASAKHADETESALKKFAKMIQRRVDKRGNK